MLAMEEEKLSAETKITSEKIRLRQVLAGFKDEQAEIFMTALFNMLEKNPTMS
jgi:hypothetical protein